MSAALSVLQYLGVLLAWFAGLWGTIHDVTREDPTTGRRQLTREGQFSIVFALVGLAVSLTTMVVQAATARTKADEDARRAARTVRDLVVAGQPLTQIEFVWTLPSGGDQVRATAQAVTRLLTQQLYLELQEGDDESKFWDEDVWQRFCLDARRMDTVYAAMRFVATGEQSAPGPVLMYLPLALDRSSIISCGLLAATGDEVALETIESTSWLVNRESPQLSFRAFVARNPSPFRAENSVTAQGDGMILTWKFPRSTLKSSVRPLATASELSFVLLEEFDFWVITQDNTPAVNPLLYDGAWDHTIWPVDVRNPPPKPSRLTIIVNGLQINPFDYDVHCVALGEVGHPQMGPESPAQSYGVGGTFHAVRRRD